jgi:hypothetical protein
MIHPWEERVVQILAVLSIVFLMFEIDLEANSAPWVHQFLKYAELTIAAVFSLELVARCVDAAKRPRHHGKLIDGVAHGTFHHAAKSGFHTPAGLKAHFCSIEFWIDLMSVLPYWLILVTPVSWLGLLRGLRVFRLLKLYRYSHTSHMIVVELFERKRQIVVLGWISFSIAILGSVGIYELEHLAQPKAFGTVFDSMWWMIVTMTTVGYGDISPHTPAGKVFAMILMPFTLGIMGAVIGVVGGAFQDVVSSDPSVDEAKS